MRLCGKSGPRAVGNMIDTINAEGIVPHAGTDDETIPPAWVEEVSGSQCKEALEARTVDGAEENVAQQQGRLREESEETAADNPTLTTPGSTGADTKTRRAPQAGTRLDPVGVQRLLAAIGPEAPKAAASVPPVASDSPPTKLEPRQLAPQKTPDKAPSSKPSLSNLSSSSSISKPARAASKAADTLISEDEKQKILSALDKAGKPLVMWKLSESSGIPQPRLERILGVLVRQGTVNRVEAADAVRYCRA